MQRLQSSGNTHVSGIGLLLLEKGKVSLQHRQLVVDVVPGDGREEGEFLICLLQCLFRPLALSDVAVRTPVTQKVVEIIKDGYSIGRHPYNLPGFRLQGMQEVVKNTSFGNSLGNRGNKRFMPLLGCKS